ncbi:MAG TPA: BamA/TamA family outer membrane protein [Minicystis sp.]|nr:BamA/TamA family outer membrane protein [Minicystis sp.]
MTRATRRLDSGSARPSEGARAGGGGSRPGAAFALAAALALAAPLVGCVKAPYKSEVCTQPSGNGCVIEDLAVQGDVHVPAGNIKEKIATTETSRVLGGAMENVPILSIWDRLTVEYGRLDPFVLERDLARVERYYRSLGYYEAHARAARVVKKPDGKIRVEMAVDEGPPVKIGSVEIAWKDVTPQKLAFVRLPVVDAQTRLLKRGKNFEEDPYEATKKLLLRALTDHGFAYAAVEGRADVDLVKHEAKIVYTLTMGPRCTFGPIRFVGLGDLPESLFRAALDMQEGQEYSTAKLDSAQIALANFGVLGAIDVVSETSPAGQPENPVVPITFKAQKTQLRTVRAGMGAQIGDRLEAHGILGWENRNFFGGLRHFTVDFEPGFIFYPVTINNVFSQPPTRILPEALVRGELRQPLWFSPRTQGVVGASFNFYRLQTADTVNEVPITYSAATDPKTGMVTLQKYEQDIVGYREVAGRVGVERTFWDNRQYVGAFYNIQFDNPFSYNTDTVPAGYANLVISYVDFIGTLDLRKNAEGKLDKLHPNSGVYFSNDFQFAGIGGDVMDFRIRPEFRAYLPLSKKVTIAFKAALGMLFPFGYADPLLAHPAEPCSNTPPKPGSKEATDEAARARALQILQFRAFFSGGPNSNRGYPYNGVGPQEDLHLVTSNIPCGEQVVATGGLSLWESSIELRFPIVGKLGGVIFLDGSDVYRKVADFRLTFPHVSTGFGIRYDTPVGPLRADLGYRIPCLQELGQCRYDVPPSEGQGSLLGVSTQADGSNYGIPFALSIAIGEAF